VVGEVSAEVARSLGLGPGVRVITGTPDLHSAAAGSGSVLEYEAHLTISTTSWVSCPLDRKKTDPVHQIATVPGLPPGPGASAAYLVANNHETGGRCLEWLRDLLGAGPPGPVIGYDTLTAAAATVVPGSNGAIFTPWLAGERSPVDDRNARGGFHNLSLRTTRAELVRSVLEGVAYNSRWLAEAVDRFVGRRLEPIRLVGGGATSSLWCQIHADVLDRPIERVAEPVDANLRGAALLAGLALGHLDPGELRSLVPIDGRFTPDPRAHRTYDHLYAEFPRLYSAQKPMFARLNRPG
jgi:xylulokinase